MTVENPKHKNTSEAGKPAGVKRVNGAVCGQIVDVIEEISHWPASVVRDELLEQTNLDPDDKHEWCGIYIEDWEPWMNEHEDDGGFADFNSIYLSQGMVNENEAIVLVPYRDEIQIVKNMIEEFKKIVKRVESFLESHYDVEHDETLKEARKHGYIYDDDLFEILFQSGEFDDVESQLYNAIRAIPNDWLYER